MSEAKKTPVRSVDDCVDDVREGTRAYFSLEYKKQAVKNCVNFLIVGYSTVNESNYIV